MHELGICRNIVAIAVEAARGRRVVRVTLEVGKLSGVLSEALQFCFPIAAADTVLAGAILDIIEIPGRARCSACGAEIGIATFVASCSCGCRRLARLAGEELSVKSIAMEEATRFPSSARDRRCRDIRV